MRKKIAVLDYGIGNVRSQLNALQYLGVEAVLTSDYSEVMQSDAAILPGVGAFRHGMENLLKAGLKPVINEFISTGKPFLGICLGMQLLFEESDEFGYCEGLGLISGRITKLSGGNEKGLKLPHIGWTDIYPPVGKKWESTLLNDTGEGTPYYFVHSYAAVAAAESDVLATAKYGDNTFCCAIEKDNIFGTQFHPEKSGEMGLNILRNLVNKA